MRAKFLVIAIAILAHSPVSFAQQMSVSDPYPYLTKCKIVFDVTYSGAQPTGADAATIPAGKIVYLKDDMMRIETKMADGHTEIQLVDFKNKIEHALIEVSGKKYAVKSIPDDIQKQCKEIPYLEVKNIDDFKGIAGYSCQKYEYLITNKKNDTFTCDIYTNFKMIVTNPNWFYPQFREVAYFMFEYSIKQNDVIAKVTAKSVEPFNENESIFKVPSGYKSITKEEFSKLQPNSVN